MAQHAGAGIRRRVGVYRICHQLYSNNWRNHRVQFANSVFTGGQSEFAHTNLGGDGSDWPAIIEPKLTGKTLNLSTLAILINLVFWGLLWGVAGMFFSVPLLVATFIITAQFDSTRWIAILLSADGNIPDKRESE